MQIKLQKIANITSGFYAKQGLPEEVIYLQGRDIDERNKLREELYPSAPLTESMQKHLLAKGDVLVASKGNSFYSIAWDREGSAVASTHFLVVEPDRKKILPAYLTWFINLQTTQEHLLRNARGSSVLSINRKDLGDLEIPLVPMALQHDIVELDRLQTQEDQLLSKLKSLKKMLTENQLLKFVNDHE